MLFPDLNMVMIVTDNQTFYTCLVSHFETKQIIKQDWGTKPGHKRETMHSTALPCTDLPSSQAEHQGLPATAFTCSPKQSFNNPTESTITTKGNWMILSFRVCKWIQFFWIR